MIVVTAESELTHNGISPYYWTPAAGISCVMAVYTLIYAAIYSDGFRVTCKQYSESLLKELQGAGNIVPVIKGRLSCDAIFDFMDYLVESISYERRKYGRINTGACLYMTLICSWLTVIFWIMITVVNVMQARRTQSARV